MAKDRTEFESRLAYILQTLEPSDGTFRIDYHIGQEEWHVGLVDTDNFFVEESKTDCKDLCLALKMFYDNAYMKQYNDSKLEISYL